MYIRLSRDKQIVFIDFSLTVVRLFSINKYILCEILCNYESWLIYRVKIFEWIFEINVIRNKFVANISFSYNNNNKYIDIFNKTAHIHTIKFINKYIFLYKNIFRILGEDSFAYFKKPAKKRTNLWTDPITWWMAFDLN